MSVLAGMAFAAVLAGGTVGCSSAPAPQAGSGSDAGAATAPATPSETADASAASASPSTPAEKGKQFFQQSCANCHGMNGQGVPHLGADLRTSKYVAKSSDATLAGLIEHGVPANDPRNTSHIPMPPKGANPSLTRQDIQEIVSYIRQLQKDGSKTQ
jgi:mono/diheme cytochrome c family protein